MEILAVHSDNKSYRGKSEPALETGTFLVVQPFATGVLYHGEFVYR